MSKLNKLPPVKSTGFFVFSPTNYPQKPPIADWAAVDRLEGYPRLYDRQHISCTLADETTDTGWIYIMNNLPQMATVIKSGDWKEHYHG